MNATLAAIMVAAAGGLGALAGSSITSLLGLRSARQARRQDQMRHDAETVGDVLAFLVESHPDRVLINYPGDQDEATQLHRHLIERRDEVRAGLLRLAAGHPDETVSKTARELEVAVFRLVTWVGWAMGSVAGKRSSGDLVENRDQAKEEYDAAEQLAEQLLTLVRAYDGG